MTSNLSIGKKTIVIGLFLLLFSLFFINSTPKHASAAYDGGRLIDNNVFLNSASMSAQDIQLFLVARGGALASKTFIMDCPAAGAQANAAYISLGAPCGQTVLASSIIYYTAQVYGVNPRVIIATMQKEQSLITATNPTNRQYSQAMGYGCPTTGSCDDSSNFFWQVDNGTWVLRFHYERARGNFSWWYTSTSWTCGTEKNFYKPNLYPNQNVNFYDEDSVLYRTQYISNAATSAFYCYTPHAYNNPLGLFGRAPFGNVGRYYSGSYNFVLFYELWFGSTIGNGYEFVDAINPPNTMLPNDVVGARIRIKNTSGLTWYSDGNVPVGEHALRLATFGYQPTPYGNTGDSVWLGTKNQIKMKEASVVDGGIATFEFTFRAPVQQINSYMTQFTPVLDGASFMPYIGLSFTTSTPAPNLSYSVVATSGLSSNLPTNYTKAVSYTIRNTGNIVWWGETGKMPGAPSVRLFTINPAYHSSNFFESSSWISNNQIGFAQAGRLGPGEDAHFGFNIKTPLNNGVYFEDFGLIIDGVSPYPQVEIIKPRIEVADYTFSIVSNSLPATLIPGQKYESSIVIKNTGTATWYADGSTPPGVAPARLITAGYAPHPLRDESDVRWLANSQVKMLTSSVAPGQNGEFKFNFLAPFAQTTALSDFKVIIDGTYMMSGYIQKSTSVSPLQFSYTHVGGTHPALTSLTPGQITTGKLILKNTSNFVWYNDSSRPSQFRGGAVRVVMASPYYRASVFANPADAAWLGTSSQIRMTTPVVNPGENAEFDFTWKAPQQKGTYKDMFSVVLDGYGLFPFLGMELSGTVQ